MNDQLDVSAMLVEQLDRLFSAEIQRSLRQSVEREGRYPAALWRDIEGLGVHLAMAGEAVGGAALSWAQAEPLLRKMGEYAAPLPLGETMLAAWAMSAAGLDIPAGPIAIATAPFVWADGRISGDDALVAWPKASASLLLVARGKDPDGTDGPRLCVIDSAEATWSACESYARIPSASLRLSAVSPVQSAALPATFGELGLLPALATLRSVQMAGLLDHVLALCVDYAKSRVQFGKPIGKFQAIQQMLAELAGHSAAAQVAGLYACRRLDIGAGEQGAAIGKIRTGLAATRGAAIAHQVFGAIGITDEHELHYYTRRLWQWRAEAGSDHFWSEHLGRQVLAGGGAALWPAIGGPV